MFMNGIAYAVILIPAFITLFVGFIIFSTAFINRRYPPFGWLVPIAVCIAAFSWYERDRNGPDNPESKGTVEFRMSDNIKDVRRQSTFKFPKSDVYFNQSLSTGEVIDVRFDTGFGKIDFLKVGGLSNSFLDINFRDHSAGIAYARFDAQHTPLKLESALARARQIEAQFLKTGFISQDREPHCRRFKPIKASFRGQIHPIETWSDAETALRDTHLGITEIELMCMVSGTTKVSLKLENWARGHSSIYSHNFGREWGMVVEIEG